MRYKLEEVAAIGSLNGSKLAQESISSTEDLLRTCGTPADRDRLSERTGISSQTLLKWVRLADLMRIAGVSPQFAELLEASGVDTVGQLGNRNATTAFEPGSGSSISGGLNNEAIGPFASIGGGRENVAVGFYSSISGGRSPRRDVELWALGLS